MNVWLNSLLWTLALTPLFFVILVWRFPRLIMRRCLRRLAEEMGHAPWNSLHFGGLAQPRERSVAMTSPDMLTLFGAYDVSRGPVRIRVPLADRETYCSLSLYAFNTDNFFVRNNQKAGTHMIDVTLVGPGQGPAACAGPDTLIAPTRKVVVIVRAIVKDRYDPAEIDRMERFLKTVTIQQADSRAPSPIL